MDRLRPPESVNTASPGATSDDRLSVQERAWLLRVREELLVPVNNLISLSEMLREESRDLDQPTFRSDLDKIHTAAGQLLSLADEFLDPGLIDLLTPQALAVLQSRVRHDMLNALNPVINYSELWLEDAEEEFLGAFVDDLRRIHALGK